MKHYRFLLLLLALLTGMAAEAQFNPNNPDEPGARPWQLTLKTIPAEAGYFSVNQQTNHVAGEQIWISAYSHNGFRFLKWEDEQGNTISTENSINYTMPSANATLVARYEFNPGNPDEPGKATIKRRLTLKANPEGTGHFNLNANSDIAVGEVVNIRAYNYSQYQFSSWTEYGNVVSSSAAFAYTMPDRDVTLVANFEFQPGLPNEPGEPQNEYYNIYGVRVGAVAGQTVSYPIYLENRGAAVNGLQVDVTLPKGFSTDASAMTLADRAGGHTLKATKTDTGAWRITISGANTIDGVDGQVLTLPIHVPDTATVGCVFNILLSDGKVFKAGGEEQSVTVRDGSLKIVPTGGETANSPDYVVTDVNVTTTTVQPGGGISLSWKVQNQGKIAGKGGWTERIYLVASDGRKVSIGSASQDATELKPGATVSRSATIALAQLPGIDGKADVAVTIVPSQSAGEAGDLALNNTTQTSGLPITIGKRLVLTIPSAPQQEGEVTTVTCQLARSGNWTQTETYTLKKLKGDSRVTVPETVVIPREQAAAYFYLTLADDDMCNNDSIVSLRVEGNGYEAVEGTLIIRDDELYPLGLTPSASEITEGETFQLTVTLAQPAEQPLTVSLTAEQPKRFRLPATVVIPAGQTKASVDVTAIDNEIPDGDVSCAFIAYADGYEPSETIVILNDNDLPVLELTFTPNKVKEGDGPVSITGTLHRLTNTDKKVTVRLSDDSNGGLYFSQRELTLAKGVQQATFSLGPIDNSTVDGDRQYTVTAAVWLSSCSCSASGQAAGNVTAQIEVFDDDGPALSLTSSQATVREGVTTRITVTRNTSTEKALTVRLTSDHDYMLTYNHTLVIPAGQQSAYAEVTPAANDTQNDTKTVVFTAEAEGFSSGTCYILVTDQTLPDAVITDISVDEQEVEAGGTVTVNVTITNRGVSVLPEETRVDFFIIGNNTPISTLHTHSDVAPDGSITMTKILRLPTVTGSRSLYCVVNNNREVNELLYSNNTSNYLNIQLLSPYRATVACDKEVFLPGEIITMTGKVEGNVSANSEVEIYLINDGSRQTLSTLTDSEGKFSLSYKPYEKQMGHFVIGACYPGEETNTEQAAFDYIGIRRTSQNYITCEVLVGTPYQGTIEVENPTALSQHNIHAEVLSIPDNCSISFSPVSEIGAGGKYSLNYTIEGTAAFEGTDWKSIKVCIKSDEGASTEVLLYCYCMLPKAQLALDVTEINTTVTKGTPRDYPISITNNGAGKTGRIILSLPSLIQTTTSQSIASINPGETATVSLRLTTTENMPLNVPYTGQIGINCENGNGIALPFTLLPVAETKGTLIVDVCDEYTYYTEEAPHVKGAKVTVKYPYSDEVIATGTTDDNGLFEVELSEGYYALTVTADKHVSYQNNLLIDPGKENKKVVNLSYEGITVNWNVEETEVEDEYEIKTTVTYETNVPVPIVITELPDYIPVDSMASGESRLFYATLTNKGLIAAEGVQLIFPETEYLTFEPLVDFPITLMPQQSIVVPFKFTLSQDVVPEESNDVAGSRMDSPPKARKWKIVCVADPKTIWFHWCGNDHQYHHYKTPIRLSFWKKCHIEGEHDEEDDEKGGIPDGNGGIIWIHGSSGGGGTPTKNVTGCRTCLEILLDKAKDKLIGDIPVIGCFISTALCTKESIDRAKNDEVGIPDIKTMSCEMDAIECAVGEISGLHTLKLILDILSTIIDFKECFWISFESDPKKARKAPSDANVPSFVKEMDIYNQMLTRELQAIIEYHQELFGDEDWSETDCAELLSFLKALDKNGNKHLTASDFSELKPSNITIEKLNRFVCRMNNTFFGENNEMGGYIDFGHIEDCVNRIIAEEEHAQQLGYSTVVDLWTKEFSKYYERLSEGSSSVCASVTLEIKQTMTLNRPAYRGTLEVFNGHEDMAMTDVRLDLIVKDEYGNVATAHEFQINAESLDNFGGEVSLDDAWTLDAQQTGKATVLFIPTKYAAPTEPKKYLFGGTLNYIDPFTGLEKSMSLIPVQLTVNPLPDLELTYLMQRDVYGDDPLTENVVEPMEEAEFALIINNKGYGEAKNVRMLTEQPKITENEKGLLIDFQLVSSQVNGEPATLSFGQTIANSFGTIPAHSQAYAQWWLESSLLGHFTSYEVAARHVTSYGNQDLSLVDTVTIHEMVHGFTPKSNVKRGWLVNDIVDADDMPDVVYFSDATQQTLNMSTGAIDKKSETEYELIVTPRIQGWNYGSVTDPTNGKQKLVKIVRQSDGAEIPVDNVWQTDRTLRDGSDWLYENRLHFVGEMANGSETYLLTFEAAPDNVLEVESFIGVPPEGTLQTTPLNEVTVRFNKPIRTETFTSDDISLRWEGIEQDNTFITINKQNDTDYLLNLSQVNRQDGYYVLTIQTATIADSGGFNGRDGKSASWVQYLQTENPKTYFYVTINDAGYATFYDSQWNYMLPSELKASVVSAAANDKLTYTVLAGNVVPKGVAVMLEATPRQAGTYTLTSTEGGAIYSGINLLRGSDVPTFISLTSGEQAYKLAYGPSGTEWNEVFGWYWGADDGGPFRIEGHKAWLVLPATMSTRGFSVDGDAFGIEDADPSALIHESPVYDLQGRQVNLRRKKGVYVSKGKKMIVK